MRRQITLYIPAVPRRNSLPMQFVRSLPVRSALTFFRRVAPTIRSRVFIPLGQRRDKRNQAILNGKAARCC